MNMQRVKNLTMTALLAALTAVCAQIMLPIPFTPVFFSMAVFAVLLSGGLLPPRWALAAQLCYLALGVFGAPVFGGMRAGPGVLLGPTGGYAVAYPLMALLAAALIKRGWKSLWQRIAACALALLPCYALGTAWLAVSTGRTLWEALLGGVVPFILPDLLKAVLAGGLSLRLEKPLKAGGR